MYISIHTYIYIYIYIYKRMYMLVNTLFSFLQKRNKCFFLKKEKRTQQLQLKVSFAMNSTIFTHGQSKRKR